ncbi:hypothetical protein COCNU_08G001670 [Cocos nucifera]|uniref:Uncharacterized protein n=1 Tax=Cocos nucifera TaxID=13894 RepID=A0A8K0N5S0_COCNU|nr:hypothetical protein COCNU_08G001670 [Cocos nucifera]
MRQKGGAVLLWSAGGRGRRHGPPRPPPDHRISSRPPPGELPFSPPPSLPTLSPPRNQDSQVRLCPCLILAATTVDGRDVIAFPSLHLLWVAVMEKPPIAEPSKSEGYNLRSLIGMK